MSKKILHFQVSTNKNGYPTMHPGDLKRELEKIKKILPKYYKIIVSPFDITIDKKTIVIDKSNLKNISDEEKWIELITDMIEKEGYIIKLIK